MGFYSCSVGHCFFSRNDWHNRACSKCGNVVRRSDEIAVSLQRRHDSGGRLRSDEYALLRAFERGPASRRSVARRQLGARGPGGRSSSRRSGARASRAGGRRRYGRR